MIYIRFRRPPLYPLQQAIVDCPARYTVVEASTKSGKTVACLIWLLERAMADCNGGQFWWVAPVQEQADIAFRRLERWLRRARLGERFWRPRRGRHAIELPNQTCICFHGGDNPDHLYGEDVRAAVIDEASRCKAEAWYALRSTLSATCGPVKIIGNVRGRHNWAWKLARQAQAGAQDMAYFHLTARDAVAGGVLDAQEIDDAQRALPPAVFRELYMAQASDDGSNPFGLDAIHAATLPALSTRPAVVFGVDLAKARDWTVVCGLDDGGRLCLLERWQGVDWQQSIERIVQAVGSRPALVDSTGVGDPVLEQLQKRGPRFQGFCFSSQSKQQLMEGLAVALRQQQVGIAEDWLIAELQAFEFSYTRQGVRYSAPSGVHDDGVCALALAVRQQATLAHAPTLDARLLGGPGGPKKPGAPGAKAVAAGSSRRTGLLVR